MSRSREGLTLVSDASKPPFTNELRSWIGAWMQRNGVLTFYQTELAEQMGVNKQALSDWVRGMKIPSRDSCAIIARFFGLHEDYVLNAAGHPTFSTMLSGIEAYRFKWSDGQYIYAALKLTEDRTWRYSQSMWKIAAQEQLERWRPSMSEEEFHTVAFRVAMFIDAWNLDRTREQPPAQRHIVAMSA